MPVRDVWYGKTTLEKMLTTVVASSLWTFVSCVPVLCPLSAKKERRDAHWQMTIDDDEGSSADVIPVQILKEVEIVARKGLNSEQPLSYLFNPRTPPLS